MLASRMVKHIRIKFKALNIKLTYLKYRLFRCAPTKMFKFSGVYSVCSMVKTENFSRIFCSVFLMLEWNFSGYIIKRLISCFWKKFEKYTKVRILDLFSFYMELMLTWIFSLTPFTISFFKYETCIFLMHLNHLYPSIKKTIKQSAETLSFSHATYTVNTLKL